MKFLPWISCAARPMTLEELQECVKIEILQPHSMRERRVNGIGRIGAWFQGLVDIDEESRTVSFSHASIKAYFLDPGIHIFKINTSEADHYIGEICMTYLFFSDFQTAVVKRVKAAPPVTPIDIARSALRQGLNMPRFDSLGSESHRAPRSTRPNVRDNLATFLRADGDDDALANLAETNPFVHYASLNCYFHTKNFTESGSRTWTSWLRTMYKGHDLVQRPWKSGDDKRADYLATLFWACDTCHGPLIEYLRYWDADPLDFDKMMIALGAPRIRHGSIGAFHSSAEENLFVYMVWSENTQALGLLMSGIPRTRDAQVGYMIATASVAFHQYEMAHWLIHDTTWVCSWTWPDLASLLWSAAKINNPLLVGLFLSLWVVEKDNEHHLDAVLKYADEEGYDQIKQQMLDAARSSRSWLDRGSFGLNVPGPFDPQAAFITNPMYGMKRENPHAAWMDDALGIATGEVAKLLRAACARDPIKGMY